MFDPHDTLCIYCAKACCNKCSWSESKTPVDGWDAEQTEKGYLVKSCPLFVRDVYTNTLGEEWIDRHFQTYTDADGCIALLGAVLRQLKEDYIAGKDRHTMQKGESRAEAQMKNRLLIEKRIRTHSFQSLFHVDDPEALISFLRKELKRAKQKGMVI